MNKSDAWLWLAVVAICIGSFMAMRTRIKLAERICQLEADVECLVQNSDTWEFTEDPNYGAVYWEP